VKELKANEVTRIRGTLAIPWNPVKELKDQHRLSADSR